MEPVASLTSPRPVFAAAFPAPPVSASLVSGVEPILTPVLVALVVGETISGLSLAGGVIVFVTIMVYNVLSARLEAKQAAA